MNRTTALLLTFPLLAACSGDDGSPTPFYAPVRGASFPGAPARYDWGGYSFAPAGDIDGDGAADLLFVSHASGEGGRVALHLGPLTRDRAPADAALRIRGEYGFANLGDNIARAGGCDVDGDGFADLLLGSPFADTSDVAATPIRSGDNAGKAYIFFGGPDLVGDVAATAADVQLLGEAPYDTAGTFVACLGDLDGDGRGDVAVSAKGSARGGEDAGAVYLIYGRAGLPRTLALADADALFVGDEPFAQAGVSVVAPGDMTGDGRPDLLIGAPNSDRAGDESGVVHLIPGTDTRFAGPQQLAGAIHLAVAEPGLRLGWTIDRAGDLDGDGIADAILGTSVAPVRTDHPGSAFVVLGGAGLSGVVDLRSRGVELAGARPGDLAGIGVAGVGDVSGDGFDDVVVGALRADGDAPGSGRIFLIRGRREFPASIPLTAADWSIGGTTRDEHFGETLAGGLDLDGDGYPDFAASAKSRSAGQPSVGAVDLFLAQRDRLSEETD